MKTETENLRELDAWIAERVMGWRRSKIDTLTTGDSFYIHSREDVLIQYSYNRLKTFHPTTDPAAAMQVLEKCAERLGHTPSFTRHEDSWIFTDQSGANHKDIPTLWLAICKFAKALYSK